MITRRGFIKGLFAGIGALAVGFGGAKAPIPKTVSFALGIDVPQDATAFEALDAKKLLARTMLRSMKLQQNRLWQTPLTFVETDMVAFTRIVCRAKVVTT